MLNLEVQIKNFELVTDQVLGSESYPFWSGVSEANYPIFVLDIKEIGAYKKPLINEYAAGKKEVSA